MSLCGMGFRQVSRPVPDDGNHDCPDLRSPARPLVPRLPRVPRSLAPPFLSSYGHRVRL
jgi:hypothetical protein